MAYKIFIYEKNADGTNGALVDETRVFQTLPEAVGAQELLQAYFNTEFLNIEIHSLEN